MQPKMLWLLKQKTHASNVKVNTIPVTPPPKKKKSPDYSRGKKQKQTVFGKSGPQAFLHVQLLKQEKKHGIKFLEYFIYWRLKPEPHQFFVSAAAKSKMMRLRSAATVCIFV
jgi:hypothetical protein